MLCMRVIVFHPRRRYITRGARKSTSTRVPPFPQPLMCNLRNWGGSRSISRANWAGRRRRRRGGRRSLMKNSQGWSPTWPSIGKGIIGRGGAGAPPRPPLPRALRPLPRPRPRPRPLPLPLAAGSTTAGSGGGGARCRAATLAATVEGPRFPFSMAGERKKQKQEDVEDGRMRDAIPPSPSL